MHTMQLHAAAVNGNKHTLHRLAIGYGYGKLDYVDPFGRSPLMYCVLADRLDCAKLLLRHGSSVNLKDNFGYSSLHWAAYKGNYRIMKLLLSQGADYREKNISGQTALHLCTGHKIKKCIIIMMRQLLASEIDNQDNYKRTALHWASFYGNLKHVKLLIKQDSNIGIPDIDGKTPLHLAASSKDPEALQCLKLILEATPSVINWQDYEGRIALHLAVAEGNYNVVCCLTSFASLNISALDNVFRTPLHWAAALGHSNIVRQLLHCKADCYCSDANGATSLHYAVHANSVDTVQVFLKQACTDEPDMEGRTAFMWAAGRGYNDILSVFFSHHVYLQQEDKAGNTGVGEKVCWYCHGHLLLVLQALHAAAWSGHAATVRLLLLSGALIDSVDHSRHTPLSRACEAGHAGVVMALIENSARLDLLDDDGRTPLHWAASTGYAHICQILIKYGVDPNIGDNRWRRPLHCAAYSGYVSCMSILIDHQADANVSDKQGMSSLHWGCCKGHLDAVKFLVEHKAYPNQMSFSEDRYTPLDYALMGDYQDVCQYLIEQGALSITGIEHIAATKIQSFFRGYRVQNNFVQRKKLIMKHESLKKRAARKKACEGE